MWRRRQPSPVRERLRSFSAMLLIGDGLLAMISPDEHLRTWGGRGRAGDVVDTLHRRPWLVQLAGAIEAAIGLYLGVCRSRRCR